jgi:chemotaxis protein CheD
MTEQPAQPLQTAMIGIGEHRTGAFPMASIGLGSCISLVFFDRDLKIGSMAHIMLPESSGRTDRPGKYADLAIPLLIGEMQAGGSGKAAITARMAGGATMFETFSAGMNIGERNIEKVRSLLLKENIRIVAEDVGGKMGRSVYFFPRENGKMTVRLANGTNRDL